MLDIKFVREHADEVKENMKKKFQDKKIPLVNEVLLEDKELRQVQQHADDLRAQRKKISKEIGTLMGQGKKEEAEEVRIKFAIWRMNWRLWKKKKKAYVNRFVIK